MSAQDIRRYALTLEAPSARGQVAAITALLERRGAYVEEFSVFDDVPTERFYLRTQFRAPQGAGYEPSQLAHEGCEVLAAFPGSRVGVFDRRAPVPILVMVSKTDHCLRELLTQIDSGGLPVRIVAVVSNHRDLEPVVREHGLPFHHLPVTPETKPQQEARLLALVHGLGAEFVVLARYMQVLSEEVCAQLPGRVINIHHSFLPGFKGARPYLQAWERGVKLIGATAHFVTTDLDEGPIIEQALERVDHRCLPETLLNIGRHIESRVLEQAVRLVAERRVFINGLRTVVLQ